MAYTFEPASRGSAKPLIGIYAESGCGKTYSALLLARGFVGPKGRIGMIETESGRGEAYASPAEYPELAGPDPLANYAVLRLRDNFAPAEYGKALKAAEDATLDALIIDSGSHEWEGPGGVLAMAAKNQETLSGVLVWQQPKIQHQREFMLRFMQTPIPLVILCMRAKYPMEQVEIEKDGRKKKEWVRSKVLEPKQSEDILFEMFVHGWIDQEHKFHLTKSTSKTLTPVFAEGQMITLETGRQLASWAKGGAAQTTQRSEPEKNQPTTGKTQREIVEQTKKDLAEAAEGGTHPLTVAWERLTQKQRDYLRAYYDDFLYPIASGVDANSQSEEQPI
jgi:hypothetical protein